MSWLCGACAMQGVGLTCRLPATAEPPVCPASGHCLRLAAGLPLAPDPADIGSRCCSEQAQSEAVRTVGAELSRTSGACLEYMCTAVAAC